LRTIPGMPAPTSPPDPRIRSLPAAELRRRFLDFFAGRGHTVVPIRRRRLSEEA